MYNSQEGRICIAGATFEVIMVVKIPSHGLLGCDAM
jgi:hypothetical protein